MSTTFKKYDLYKTSNTEWLGVIPAHWEVKKLKYVLSEKLKYGANESAEEENINDPRYIRITDFGDDGKLRDNTFKSLQIDLAKEYFLKEGDILFARSGATVGKTFQFKNYEGLACFAGYLIKASVDVKQMLSDYLYLFTKSGIYENWKSSIFIQATIQNIGADKYSLLEIPVPPVNEQQKIAQYLDTKTVEIDDLIQKKQKLIALLREERTALINQAVTKGIHTEGVTFKYSGIEWLGDIPEHWAVKKLKYLLDIQGRIGFKGYNTSDIVNYGEGAITIGAKHITKSNKLNLDNPEFLSWEKYYESPEIMVEKGQILVVQRGSLGKVALIEDDIGEATINPSIQILKNIKINSNFLLCLLSSNFFLCFIELINSSTAVPMISQEQLENFNIPVPPQYEQEKIVGYIEKETQRIDELIDKIEAEISLLQEYRTALISEVVTGKVRVVE